MPKCVIVKVNGYHQLNGHGDPEINWNAIIDSFDPVEMSEDDIKMWNMYNQVVQPKGYGDDLGYYVLIQMVEKESFDGLFARIKEAAKVDEQKQKQKAIAAAKRKESAAFRDKKAKEAKLAKMKSKIEQLEKEIK